MLQPFGFWSLPNSQFSCNDHIMLQEQIVGWMQGSSKGHKSRNMTPTAKLKEIFKAKPGTLNNQFFMVVSIGWFKIFTWEMVVSPNIHL